VFLVRKGPLVQRVLQVQLVLLVIPVVLQVQLVFPERPAQKVPQEPLVLLDQWVYLVQQEHKVQQVRQVLRVVLVQQEQQGRLDQPELRDPLELLARQDRPEPRAPTELPEPLV
jgi:hypothetical protein